jgi:hypothetical protein
MADEWTFYEPKTECMIHMFDDGNEKYSLFPNRWRQYGDWRGKVALVNAHDATVRITSISAWKICNIEPFSYGNVSGADVSKKTVAPQTKYE